MIQTDEPRARDVGSPRDPTLGTLAEATRRSQASCSGPGPSRPHNGQGIGLSLHPGSLSRGMRDRAKV